MSTWRTFVAVFAAGVWTEFAQAALRGNLPNFSLAHWAVYIAGWLVISLAFCYLQRRFWPSRGKDDPA